MNTTKRQNPVAVALQKRHGRTQTSMRHKADRRPKDARRSWKREL